VVAGRADGGEGVADLSLQDGIDGGESATGGVQRDLEGVFAESGVAGAELAGAAGDVVSNDIPVVGAVAEVDIVGGGGAKGEAGERVEQASGAEGVAEDVVALGALRMTVTRVMLFEADVEDEASGLRGSGAPRHECHCGRTKHRRRDGKADLKG
jgi:hypothetical protein